MNNQFKCIIVDDEPMAREIIESFIEKTPSLQLLASCKSAMEAIPFINKDIVDVFFLDINMPDINGLGLAKIIGKKSHVIFTTAYRDYAIDGFNLQATDYLLKPIAFDRFLQAVQKVYANTDNRQKRNTVEETKNKESIFVRADRKMVKIDFDNIIYIESIGDYLKIYLNKKTITTRETITKLAQVLPQNRFMRVHRSYIVPISKISSYTNEYIELDKKAIPISRSYKESVLQKLAEM